MKEVIITLIVIAVLVVAITDVVGTSVEKIRTDMAEKIKIE